MPPWFDSHAHVDGPEFDADRTEVLQRARDAGVSHMVVIGAVGEPSSATRAVALAEADAAIWATVATHPHDVEKMTPEWWAVHQRLSTHDRVVAIGETGLDYYYDHSPRQLQRECFVRFIELARSVNKPVVCHIRDAHDDAIAVLRDTHAAALGVIIHCFTGTPHDAARYTELGCYISFSGIITYKTAQPIRDAVAEVPLNRILLETDCPYLAPIPKRGRRNEPGFLIHTADVVAKAANVTVDQLADTTFSNTYDAFRIVRASVTSSS
jgi:TatD DNase family protein